MRTKLLSTAAAVGGLLLLAGSAHALTVQIALEQDGGTGATGRTTEATGDGVAGFIGSFGAFDVNIDTAHGTVSPLNLSLPEPDLNSNAQGTTSTGCGTACTLKVFVTETGLTISKGPNAIFQSAFTWNSVLGDFNVNGSQITFSNYIDTSNTAFGEAELLDSAAGNKAVQSAPLVFDKAVTDLTTPFSETLEYDFTCNGGACSSNLTDDLSAVPEPASLSLLGGGLLAFGAWRRRRSQKV